MNINTYILSTYAALQTEDHADLQLLKESVIAHGGTCTVLPQTVIARMDNNQYIRFTYTDASMTNGANMLCLHTYTAD